MSKQLHKRGSRDIAIDLGTSSVLVAGTGRGIFLEEPSVVAVDRQSGRVLAVGEVARQMLGRTPGDLIAIRPLREGVITDYTVAQAMLRHFLQKAVSGRLLKPRVLLCVPSGVTEVEERAVVDAGLQSGARQVYLMEEPLAAALGAGIDIYRPEGHMVVDIGGGTTDLAVIALGGVVTASCLRFAGDSFDRALVDYVLQKHDLLLGLRTATELKENIGCITPNKKGETLCVKGRCLSTGLPHEITLSAEETAEAFAPTAEHIVCAVREVLERTPPELAADVAECGILLTGGGSLLRGMDTLIAERTGIACTVAEAPLSCVALGLTESLSELPHRREGTQNFARRRQLAGVEG